MTVIYSPDGCEARGGNLDDFFKHENHAWPPSISEFGQLRTSVKSDIIGCLEGVVPDHDQPNNLDLVLLDGAVIVNLIRPTETMKTFRDYIDKGFVPYIHGQLNRSKE